eukprot:Opistho-2@75075
MARGRLFRRERSNALPRTPGNGRHFSCHGSCCRICHQRRLIRPRRGGPQQVLQGVDGRQRNLPAVAERGALHKFEEKSPRTREFGVRVTLARPGCNRALVSSKHTCDASEREHTGLVPLLCRRVARVVHDDAPPIAAAPNYGRRVLVRGQRRCSLDVVQQRKQYAPHARVPRRRLQQGPVSLHCRKQSLTCALPDLGARVDAEFRQPSKHSEPQPVERRAVGRGRLRGRVAGKGVAHRHAVLAEKVRHVPEEANGGERDVHVCALEAKARDGINARGQTRDRQSRQKVSNYELESLKGEPDKRGVDRARVLEGVGCGRHNRRADNLKHGGPRSAQGLAGGLQHVVQALELLLAGVRVHDARQLAQRIHHKGDKAFTVGRPRRAQWRRRQRRLSGALRVRLSQAP